jgi:hypothetical protein
MTKKISWEGLDIISGDYIRFEIRKNAFLVRARASRPNKQCATKPSMASRSKPGPYQFNLRGELVKASSLLATAQLGFKQKLHESFVFEKLLLNRANSNEDNYHTTY